MSLGERPRGSARPTPNEHYNSLPRTSIEGALAIFGTEVGDLSQHLPTHRSLYPAPRKLCKLTLLLCPHKEAPKLLGRYPSRPRSTERVEDQVALVGRGQKGAAEEAQRLLGGMISVTFLPPGRGRDAPDGGDLG